MEKERKTRESLFAEKEEQWRSAEWTPKWNCAGRWRESRLSG